MKLESLPIGIVDWALVPGLETPGETGSAIARTHDLGQLKLRLVEYAPGYRADHWCAKGHIVYVVSGHLVIEHDDGSRYALSPATSWHAPDDDGPPHRVVSPEGATVFIVD